MRVTLRAARISCGYTAEQVAKHCGVSVELINELEINSNEITYNLFLKMTDLYQITPDHVYLGLESDCHHKLYLGVT